MQVSSFSLISAGSSKRASGLMSRQRGCDSLTRNSLDARGAPSLLGVAVSTESCLASKTERERYPPTPFEVRSCRPTAEPPVSGTGGWGCKSLREHSDRTVHRPRPGSSVGSSGCLKRSASQVRVLPRPCGGVNTVLLTLARVTGPARDGYRWSLGSNPRRPPNRACSSTEEHLPDVQGATVRLCPRALSR